MARKPTLGFLSGMGLFLFFNPHQNNEEFLLWVIFLESGRDRCRGEREKRCVGDTWIGCLHSCLKGSRRLNLQPRYVPLSRLAPTHISHSHAQSRRHRSPEMPLLLGKPLPGNSQCCSEPQVGSPLVMSGCHDYRRAGPLHLVGCLGTLLNIP